MKHWRNETSGELSAAAQRFIAGAEPQEGDEEMLDMYRAANPGVPDEQLFQGRGLDGEQWSLDDGAGEDGDDDFDLGERAGDASAAEPPPAQKRKPVETPHNKKYEPENKAAAGKKPKRKRG